MKRTLTFTVFACLASLLHAQSNIANSAFAEQSPPQQQQAISTTPESSTAGQGVIMTMTSNAFEESKIVSAAALQPAGSGKQNETLPVETKASSANSKVPPKQK